MSRCLLVTRPQPQAEQWVKALRGEGLQALALPLIAIEPVADTTALQQAWASLHRCAFVMFVSGNAVAQFFAAKPPHLAWPPSLRAGATGPGTAAALSAQGLQDAHIVMPAVEEGQSWDAEALWQRMAQWPWAGRQVLLVRGESGRDWLAEQWRAVGAAVHAVAAYRRVVPEWSTDEALRLQDALSQAQRHAWLFSSSEAARNLEGLRRRHAAAAAAASTMDWRGSLALATHPRIAQTAQELGFARVLTVSPSLDAVARAWHAWQHEGAQGASLQSAAPS